MDYEHSAHSRCYVCMFAAEDRAGLRPEGKPPPRRQDDRFFGAANDRRITDCGKTEEQEESSLARGTLDYLREEMGLKCGPEG